MHIVQSPGGVERYIKMLLENFNRSDFINILVCSYEYNQEHYSGLVDEFITVNMMREINMQSDINAIFKVRKLIKKYKPDIVYTHSSKAGAIGRIANLGLNSKSVYNAHGWAFNMDCSKRKRRLYQIIEKGLAITTDKIIVISDFEKDSALKNNICGENKIEVLFNGIDIEKYDSNREKYKVTKKSLGIPENAYVIGSVGRLSKQKAPDVFFEAAKEIKKYIPSAHFLWVGDGEEKENVQKIIKKYNLSTCTTLTGWVDEPMQYIFLFDQAMLLSRWEGFGLALAEYMYAEKAIVATRIDAIPNIISDRHNGLLVESENVEEVVNATLFLKSYDVDRKKMILNAKRDVLKRFNIKRVSSETANILKRI